MGVVEVRPGLPNDPNFPDVMQVSDQHQKRWKTDNIPDPAAADAADSELVLTSAGVAQGVTDLSDIAKVRRFKN